VGDQRLSPAEAWARLEAGNQRWAGGYPAHPGQDAARREQVAAGQHSFAAVVSCIDSRVPPETVFDQGVGDLFAVRTGGQTVDDLVLASIEYGPLENGTPLVVVLGHQRCGAISAAVHALRSGAQLPGHLDAIVGNLRPAYHAVAGTEAVHGGGADGKDIGGNGAGGDGAGSSHGEADQDLIDRVVRAQILRTVVALEDDGPLAALVRRGDLGIVGAYYELDTGRVTRLHALGL
jgi:carbonic anhydrase